MSMPSYLEEKEGLICIDFDDVVHDHPQTANYEGDHVIKGVPVPGVREAIEHLRKRFRVAIYSARCKDVSGYNAIRKWLSDYGIEVDIITNEKLPATVYVDDRAVRFNGDWKKCLSEILSFKTWKEKLSEKFE